MDAKKREMVIKALECWASGNPCIGSACAIFCDSTDTCDRWIGKRALALIKAMAEDCTALDEKYRMLYEENERLRAEKAVLEINYKDLKYRKIEI